MKKAKNKANGKANRHSALILATTLALGFVTGLAAPARAGSNDLDAPVFVAPSNGAAQSNPAQPNAAQTGTAQPAAETQAAAPDQLNASDRSLREDAAAPAAAPATPAEAPTTRSAPVMAASGEHSVWDETSLIGKIFIGFGTLLTVASAARMFMA